jgi:hypothetical protein
MLFFDLNTTTLAQEWFTYEGNNSWRNAYNRIATRLVNTLHWQHLQGTGKYFSINQFIFLQIWI